MEKSSAGALQLFRSFSFSKDANNARPLWEQTDLGEASVVYRNPVHRSSSLARVGSCSLVIANGRLNATGIETHFW